MTAKRRQKEQEQEREASANDHDSVESDDANVNGDGKVGERLLESLLELNSDLVGDKDLGTLSICSQSTLAATEPVWKLRWQRLVAAGFELVEPPPDNPPKHVCEHRAMMNNLSDEEHVKTRCREGYKRAVGSLSTITCLECGRMTTTVHPHILIRLCPVCASNDMTYWMIESDKAKKAFLLDEEDVSSLRKSSVPYILDFEGQFKDLSLNEVVYTSFIKHGGIDGLEGAFEAAKAQALVEFEERLAEDETYHYKPHVLKLLSRPTEHLAPLIS